METIGVEDAPRRSVGLGADGIGIAKYNPDVDLLSFDNKNPPIYHQSVSIVENRQALAWVPGTGFDHGNYQYQQHPADHSAA